MNNFFYYTGIIFMIEALRCIFSAKEEVDNYKACVKLHNKNSSPLYMTNDLESLKSNLADSIKGKILPAIIGTLMITWNIIGIIYAPEWKLFLTGISITIVGSVIIGYNKKFRTVPIVIVTNIISIIMLSIILYSHFA